MKNLKLKIEIENCYGGKLYTKLVAKSEHDEPWWYIAFQDSPTKSMRKLLEFRADINKQIDRAIEELELR